MIAQWKKGLFVAMEKKAFPIASAIMPTMYALDFTTQVKANKDAARLASPLNNAQYRLQPSYSYQFEGGKYMAGKPTVEPNSTLY